MSRAKFTQKSILSRAGFSLIETLVAVGILGIVGLGIASLTAEMARMQSSANLRSFLTSQKMRFGELIRDDNAWQKTVAANTSSMACLSAMTACTATTAATATKFHLKDGSDNTFHNGTVATSGYTLNGAACTTYPSAACPISYDVSFYYTCPTSLTTCVNPTVHVFANLLFADAYQTAAKVTVKRASYSVDVARGVGTRFDPLLVVEELSMAAGGAGAGNCTSGTWTARQMNVTSMDPAGNVVSVSGNAVTLKGPGTYSCRVSGPAFRVGTTMVRLRNSTSTMDLKSPPALASTAAPGGLATAVLEVHFSIPSNTLFYVEQYCEDSSLGTASRHLGYGSAGAYGPTTFATMSCYRNN